MRLIDADALMKAMYERAFETDGDTMWQSGCWVRYRAVEQVIKESPTIEPEPQWIPCGERLPESDERVLVYTVANEYHVWDAMPHRGKGYEWEDEEGLYHNLYEVEMWMPLPELCQQEAERREG